MQKTIIALGLGLLGAAPLAAQDNRPLAGQLWLNLADRDVPARNAVRDPYRYTGSLRYTSQPELGYSYYEANGRPEIIGFTLTNRGSEQINPRGLRESDATRSYDFLFADRAREDIHLAIVDDVDISGRYSHDNMFREMHFFPRVRIPSIEQVRDGQALKVTLPTGEYVFFDAWSKEIIGGVLEEQPIDFARDRHRRRNPRVHYHGRNLVITVAQRGEAARRARVWGQTKYAEVYYPAKYARPCRLSPRHIWDQRPRPGDNDPRLTMLHKTDASLFRTIEQQCHWDLSELRSTAQRLRVALGDDRAGTPAEPADPG